MAEQNETTAAEVTVVQPDENKGPSGEGRKFDRGGRRGSQNRRGGDRHDRSEGEKDDQFEKVVFVNRCAKVVKGGRRFSFSALVVVGDRKGKVGVGFGKANEVSEAVRKATEGAKKRQETFAVLEATIPHEVYGEFDGAKVLLRPASPGTGLIAGGVVRSVVEAAGVKDVLTKSLGSSTPSNVVQATVLALRQLRTRETIYKIRGRSVKPAKEKTEAKNN